jgi:flagellum-specific ATP synthase
MKSANRIKAIISIYKDAEDMINIGAYVKGTNPEIDTAVRTRDIINKFLQQDIREKFGFEQTVQEVIRIAKELN